MSGINWSERLKGLVEDFKATGTITENDGVLHLDAKEVGTMLRACGIFPTEAKIAQLQVEMKCDEQSNTVIYDNFYEVLCRITMDEAFKRDNEEKLYRCFLALDKNQKGYLTRDELVAYMTDPASGEPLNQEEMDEMLAASMDPKEGKIYYEEYVYSLLMENY